MLTITHRLLLASSRHPIYRCCCYLPTPTALLTRRIVSPILRGQLFTQPTCPEIARVHRPRREIATPDAHAATPDHAAVAAVHVEGVDVVARPLRCVLV